jgi:CDGSH iron-sulfur domain-containing protein 3
MAKKVATAEAFASRAWTGEARRVWTCELVGERWWCACGKSTRQPFCDGSHRGGPIGPLVVSFEVPTEVAWCACKLTTTPPWCDSRETCRAEEP